MRRIPTLDDLAMFHKLSHMAPALHSSAHHIVEPYDWPISQRHLRITYSSTAWEDLPQGYAFPRIAYLMPAGEGWEDRWVEFNSAEFQLVPPDLKDANSKGILYLQLEELPDPLIGGC